MGWFSTVFGTTGVGGGSKRCYNCQRKDRPAVRTVQTEFGPRRYCKQCANMVGVRAPTNKARRK